MLCETKKQAIKKTRSETREKRRWQKLRVFELKIDTSHCNQLQSKFLNRVFIEAKWFYNHVLSQENPFDAELRKLKDVNVKMINNYETRHLEFLSSQMRQELQERAIIAVRALKVLKSHGHKVGKLKFTREINSIELSQYNVVWWFKLRSYIHIQGCKHDFKVEGTKQLPDNCEFANAKLVRKASGYYIQVTTYTPIEFKRSTGREVGLDFGIKTSITTSDGEVFTCRIPEPACLKRLQMHASRKKKGSRNRRKIRNKINREYEHISNQKKDFACKTVSHLCRKYDKIYIQDELIKGWHKGWFGKQVQHGCLGAIKARLKTLESTRVIAAKHPTTRMCYKCLAKQSIGLDQRVFSCPCGLVEDRDVKAAKTVLLIGQNKISRSSYGTYEYTCGGDVRPELPLVESAILSEASSSS
jgi:putative transposase